MTFYLKFWNWLRRNKEIEELEGIIENLQKEIISYADRVNKLKIKIKELEEQMTRRKQQIKKPKITNNIHIQYLNALLQMKAKCPNVFLSDVYFDLTTLKEYKRFIKKDLTDLRKYKAEEFDCDNFAKVMWYFSGKWQSTMAFGIAWSRTHAFNWFLDDKFQIYVLEPQTDRIFKIEETKSKKQYYPWRLAIC